jgi:outer membrane protein OmpA-like peptidoglycan-associated protein
MSLSGKIPSAAGLCFFLLGSFLIWAEKESGLDLSYPSEAIKGAALDLQYPIQDTSGASLQSGQKEEGLISGSQALQSEVVDLKAAGAEVKESTTEIRINLQGEILFDFDKENIRSAAEPMLRQVAAIIQKYPNPNVLIEGHTDGKGSPQYNLKLSDRRAASVKTWLVAHGISEHGIRTRGWGAAKPVAPNAKPNGSDDPAGRQKNRRVEITIKK